MSKTITIIQLLNKIANGEKVPKKIKYEKLIYEYYSNDKEYKYFNGEDEWCGQTLLYAVMAGHYINEILNETVEIIEEQEEQEKIDIQKLGILGEYENFKNYDCRDIGIAFNKINQICRRINELIDLYNELIDLYQENKNRIQQLDKNIKEKQ